MDQVDLNSAALALRSADGWIESGVLRIDADVRRDAQALTAALDRMASRLTPEEIPLALRGLPERQRDALAALVHLLEIARERDRGHVSASDLDAAYWSVLPLSEALWASSHAEHAEEGTDVGSQERAADAFELYVDPGTAPPEVIAAFLAAVSDLHRAHGGAGLRFEPTGELVMAEPVT